MAPPKQFVGDLVEVDARDHTITLQVAQPVDLKIERVLPAGATDSG